LLDYLYRTPPKDAKPLQVSGMDGVMAWQISATTMAVRTDGMLLLPAWIRRHVSTDGIGVYEIPISPVISISKGGQIIRGSVSGFLVSANTAKGDHKGASAKEKTGLAGLGPSSGN